MGPYFLQRNRAILNTTVSLHDNIYIKVESFAFSYFIKDMQKTEQSTKESIREQEYEDYYYEHVNKTGTIFQQRALNIITFTHKKIKFSFSPKEIVNHISEKVIFYCSIRYAHSWWMVMRNSLPVNIRPCVYSHFLGNRIVELDNIVHTVKFIYDTLVEWSEKHQSFRKKKYEVKRTF